ncbi:MAG TPA: isocitrate lyase/phosphoenolpyruvate mutase family protein, partial [Solirubrobacterales bacterium]
MDQAELGKRFKELHDGAPFVIPNPWDAGTGRVLEALGFEALATSSSAFAFSLGRADGAAELNEVVQHVERLAAATGVPVSVDLEHGYGAAPERAALAIEAVAAVGAVGGSIEDYDPDAERLYETAEAAERIAAAAEAAARLPFRFMLTARAENHLRGNPDLDDTIARLQVYEAAGADVVYAPGLRELDDIRAVAAATERPLNVLALPSLSVEEIGAAGGQRISLGGSLAWATIEAMAEIAAGIRDDGDLSGLRPGSRVAR